MNMRQVISRSIGENLPDKEEILSAILTNSRAEAHTGDVNQKNGGYQMKRLVKTWTRKSLAAVAAVTLIMTAAIIAYALSPKTAALSLALDKEAVSPEESVSLTVSTTSKTGLSKGIVGLTMDVTYNAANLTFNAVTPTLDTNNFETSANEWESGKIRVLVYAKAFDTDTYFFAAGDNVFSLAFTVKADATITTIDNAFAVTGCQLADCAGDEAAPATEGYELISVDQPLPVKSLTVSPAAFMATLHYDSGTTEDVTADESGMLSIAGKKDSRDGYAFLGWYTDQALTTPFDTGVALTADIDLYPGFASFGTVTVEATDEFPDDTRGFALLGAQIRESDSSLRFIARISKDFINEIVGDGTVIGFGTALVSENYFNPGGGGYNDGNPQPLLKGDGLSTYVNKNTVTNVPAVNIYNDFDGYYRYTAVITGLSSDKQKTTRFSARAYITYEDANGVEHTCYATEDDNEAGDGGYKTGYGAYWKSFAQANNDLFN
ncbi:MAG: cohesin domain-containing protein [Oscillospiraceae bacterium]|nr:cohesin domain-containing protein [Oscillospiraceae bacterium]